MIGRTFSDFTIVKLLGAGNMGKVYLAVQNSLEREVAIKVAPISSFSSDNLHRFMREGKIGAAIQHPNIINIYSVGEQEDFVYIAMEYVGGPSLDFQIANKGSLPEATAWDIALRLGEGLRCALEKNIIHRDIKPSNILLTTQNFPKLADFGLSKRMHENTGITQPGLILGTPNYMSPEQASGEDCDFRDDIYSLGVALYQTLTGILPFSGKSIADVIFKHKFEPLTSVCEHIPTLKTESNFIIAKMLHKGKDDRYQSYDDLIADIKAWKEGRKLPFASNADVVKVCRYIPPQRVTQKIFGSIKSLIPRTARHKVIKTHAIILISGQPMANLSKNLPEIPTLDIQCIANPIEFSDGITKRRPSIVILDCSFGPQLVEFCEMLRRKHSHIPLFIHGMVSSTVLPGSLYNNDKQKLLRLFTPEAMQQQWHFTPCEFSLHFLRSLALRGKWTTTLAVEEEDLQGWMAFVDGHLIEVQYGTKQGPEAWDLLLESKGKWSISAKPVVTGEFCSGLEDNAYIQGIPLSNLLQFVEMDAATCLLGVYLDGECKGGVYCREGNLHDSVYEGFTGEQAVIEMLSIDDFQMTIEPFSDTNRAKTISKPIMEMLKKRRKKANSGTSKQVTEKVLRLSETIDFADSTHKKEEVTDEKTRSAITAKPASLDRQAAVFSGVEVPTKKLKASSKSSVETEQVDAFAIFLMQKGVVTEQDLQRAMAIQRTLARKIGELAIDESLLSEEQVQGILQVQKYTKKRFGELAMQMGVLTAQQIESLLRQQKEYCISLSEIMVRDGILSAEALQRERDFFDENNKGTLG